MVYAEGSTTNNDDDDLSSDLCKYEVNRKSQMSQTSTHTNERDDDEIVVLPDVEEHVHATIDPPAVDRVEDLCEHERVEDQCTMDLGVVKLLRGVAVPAVPKDPPTRKVENEHQRG